MWNEVEPGFIYILLQDDGSKTLGHQEYDGEKGQNGVKDYLCFMFDKI